MFILLHGCTTWMLSKHIEKKPRWEQYKNATCCLEQIQEAATPQNSRGTSLLTYQLGNGLLKITKELFAYKLYHVYIYIYIYICVCVCVNRILYQISHKGCCPVGWGSRLHRLHLCRGVRWLSQRVSYIWHKTNLMVRFQWFSNITIRFQSIAWSRNVFDN